VALIGDVTDQDFEERVLNSFHVNLIGALLPMRGARA